MSEQPETWTVLKVLTWTADYFRDRGIDTPRLDAELLLAATLNLDRVGLYLRYDQPLTGEELAAFREWVARRARREPVAYLLGEVEFWSLPLFVSPAVLIPRPDTEILVEEALVRGTVNARVLDIGTGSGALVAALGSERPAWQFTALDLSAEALQVAATNYQRHGLQDRVHCLMADLEHLPPGPFDLIVSNPPYIPSCELSGLMPEVRDFEPAIALDGGADGLKAYRLIASQAAQKLTAGGWLLVEVGQGQGGAVRQLFTSAGLQEVYLREDYAGIVRVVGGRRP